MRTVYLAHAIGPADADRWDRLDAAREVAVDLIREGFAPVFPGAWVYATQLSHGDDLFDYETWMALGLALVERCDALVRLPGYSPGADREVAHAMHHCIPVFDSVAALCLHSDWNRR